MFTNLCSLGLLAFGSAHAALTYRGVDWSSVPVEERTGTVHYKNAAGTAQPIEQIFKAAGVNSVRQRLWVNPANGDYNLNYNLALAKRAAAQGMSVYLDMHFSDTWADGGHQPMPAGWPTDINALTQTLYNYTLSVSNAFEAAGVRPALMSIGNEITAGLLWPTGKTNNYANIGKLLHAASRGIRESRLKSQPKIMIHLDNGWKDDTQQWWYSSMLANGLAASDFDVMGVSYYPFYGSGATLAALSKSLRDLASKWGKEIMVVETNWPTSCPKPSDPFPSDLKSIPFSADGQVTFMKKVAEVLAGVPRGTGLYYWEPAWVDNQALGSSCSSNTMFSWPGTALSSLSVFGSL